MYPTLVAGVSLGIKTSSLFLKNIETGQYYGVKRLAREGQALSRMVSFYANDNADAVKWSFNVRKQPLMFNSHSEEISNFIIFAGQD